jgi:predicted transcriptional regulator
MRVLLSIKPEFAAKIFEGSKQYEFRRAIFKNVDIKTIVVYASSPVQKVIGEFEIDLILKEDLAALWQKTKREAGIEESFFYSYFEGKQEGYAIKIKNARLYEEPLCLREDFGLVPPQSFLYLRGEVTESSAQKVPKMVKMI